MAQFACPLVSNTHCPRIWLVTLIVLVLAFLPAATATPVPEPTENLLINPRAPYFRDGAWTMIDRIQLEQLKQAESTSMAKRAPATSTIEIAVETEGANSAATTTVVTTPLPSPFDSSLAANFVGNNGNGACPRFINNFLTNATFKACYPFSLLVQGSASFFEAEKSAVTITQVLDATCAANVTECTEYLGHLADTILDQDNCLEDFQLENSVVQATYYGLLAYPELYSASCLKDPETDGYCFTAAVTNYTTPSDVYFYLLPLNNTLPGSSVPSCDWCIQNTMSIYRSASANRDHPIAETYENAAQQVNTICGPDFVAEDLPEAVVSSGGSAVYSAHGLLALSLLVAIIVGLG